MFLFALNMSDIFTELHRVYNSSEYVTRVTFCCHFEKDYTMDLLIKAGESICFNHFISELHRVFNTNDKTLSIYNLLTSIGLDNCENYESAMWIENTNIIKTHFIKQVPQYKSYANEFESFIKQIMSSCPKVNTVLINEDLLAQAMSIWYS